MGYAPSRLGPGNRRRMRMQTGYNGQPVSSHRSVTRRLPLITDHGHSRRAPVG